MPSSQLCMAFIMDPIESIAVASDTTFGLMLEAQRCGHRVLYLEPHDLRVDAGGPAAKARGVALRPEAGRHVTFTEACEVHLDEDIDVVFQRKDPPVDAAYVATTQILTLCERALVLNRPRGILAANEKLYALHFRDLMPETLVARRIPELLAFMDKLGGEMVVKPLDGKGGEGIFHVHNRDRNLFSILEQVTQFERRWIMAQRYLSAVRSEGDKRILLLEGEPLGALTRIPSEREHRANLHVGGRAEPAELDAADRRIVERLAPALRRDGLFFVGIDVIGGYLTEVNVTSPTGIREMDALYGKTLESEVIGRVEELAAARIGSLTNSKKH